MKQDQQHDDYLPEILPEIMIFCPQKHIFRTKNQVDMDTFSKTCKIQILHFSYSRLLSSRDSEKSQQPLGRFQSFFAG